MSIQYTPAGSWDSAKRLVMLLGEQGYTSEIMQLDNGQFEVRSWKA